MATPSEALTPDSSDEEIRKAVGETVQQLVSEGFNQDQAVAVALQQASEATGKDLAPPEQDRSRSQGVT